ncbi:MAG: V-type ATP synthase subunit I [Corallococcus sp.]|nr:V-type ATP synthase subunit I [Corallococcus sp.]
MAIAKMKKLTLVALSGDRDGLLDALAKSRAVELTRTAEIDHCTSNDNAESQERLTALISSVEDCVKYITDEVAAYNTLYKKSKDYIKAEIPKNSFIRPKTEMTFDGLLSMDAREAELLQKVDEVKSLADRKTELNVKLSKTESEIEKYSLYKDLPHPTDWYKSTDSVIVELGIVPSSNLAQFTEIAESFEMAEVETVGSYRQDSLVAVAVHADEKGFFEAVASCGYVKSSVECDVLASVRLNDLQSSKQALQNAIKETGVGITEYAAVIPDLQSLVDYFDFKRKKLVAVSGLENTDSTFILEAYCPADDVEKVRDAIYSVSECTVPYFTDVEQDDDNVPTLNKNNKIVSKFETVTNNYSSPHYREIDPNPVMSLFYFIIFGMMVADVGYGILLMLVGLFAKFGLKQNNGVRKLMSLFGFCGISATVIGLMYGSFFSFAMFGEGGWFGDANGLLPLLPGSSESPMVTMVLSLFLGIIHIMAGIGCNVYKLAKRKDYWGAVLDAFVWEIFFAGLILAVFNAGMDMMAYPKWSFRLPQIVGDIGLYMVIFALAVVLLTGGRRKKGIFGKIIGGFSGLYGLINYFGDVMSYIRVFGLMLSSALIGTVVNMLAGMVAGGVIGTVMGAVIMVVFHLFNLAMGLLSIYIHNGRLQYVEFFGKFYEGDGRLFVPFGSDTKYVYIKD